MICGEGFYLKEKVLKALNKCSIYYMEVDLGSAQQLQSMEQKMPVMADISEGLSIAEKEDLGHLLQNQFGLSLDEARQQPPVMLINRMATEAIDCDDVRVVEMELLKIAQEKDLKTAGLETALEQLEIAQKVFTGKEILRQLKSADAYKVAFGKMVEAYSSENLHELAMLVADERFMSKKAFKVLVINRNKRWAKAIPLLTESQSAFIAVGAGHLPGEQGLLQLLVEKGYTVNPVYR